MFLSEWREFPSAPCLAGKKKLDDSSRLDVVEIARVPDMLPSLFPSWSGSRTCQHPGVCKIYLKTTWLPRNPVLRNMWRSFDRRSYLFTSAVGSRAVEVDEIMGERKWVSLANCFGEIKRDLFISYLTISQTAN